jgi:5-methylthioadenosine/S-adenosylhomocysteine deaminase
MPSKDSVDLVIEPRWVLPIAPANTVLSDHAVAVTAGRIVAVAPTEQINASYEPRERVVRSDHALLPGFVNAHTRAATTLLRGLPVYGPRSQWLRETVLPVARSCMSPDFVRDGTQLALAEMLRAGITAFSDMYLFPEEVARAASSARMRAAIGLPVTDGPTVWAETATGHLGKAEQLWDEYRSHPGVSLYFAPHSAFGEGDQTLARVRRVADELDARVAMYLAPNEVPGRSPLARLKELGLLGPGFTAIQLGGLDEEELEIAATTGVCVVACQQSHLRIGDTLCAVAEFEARGVTVGLGTDSALSVGALDVLAEARTVALTAGLARRGASARASGGARAGGVGAVGLAGGGWHGLEDSAGRQNISSEVGATAAERFDGVSAETALRLATLGGATAIGMGAVVGSIEVGKAADLVCFDLSSLPCQAPRRPADAIVFAATRDQVSDVWLSGRAAVANGHLLTFDEQELGAMARRWAERISTGVTA